jgi:hypothetical protein
MRKMDWFDSVMLEADSSLKVGQADKFGSLILKKIPEGIEICSMQNEFKVRDFAKSKRAKETMAR